MWFLKSFRLDGKFSFQGLPIEVETAAGNIRQGIGYGGIPWKTVMRHDYGYIKGVVAVDGDDLDVFVGPNRDSKDVWIIHQKKSFNDEYDEDKVFLGFDSEEDVIGSFRSHYDHPDRYMGPISHYSMKSFKRKIKSIRKPSKLDNAGTKELLCSMEVL